MYPRRTRLQSQPQSTTVQEFERLAKKYQVDDFDGAALPGSRISNILVHIEQGKALTTYEKSYLKKQSMVLLSLAAGEIDYEEFSRLSHGDKAERIQQRECEEKEEARRLQKAYEERCRREKQERLKRESDPRYIAQCKAKKAKEESDRLRSKYGLTAYIEKEDFRRVMDLLRTLDSERRLSKKDVTWLSVNNEYFTPTMRRHHHAKELRNREEQERLKRESDPRYIAQRKAIEESSCLRRRYGLPEHIEKKEDALLRVVGVLKMLDSEHRLPEEDFVWLCANNEYFTPTMRQHHHRIEALFYTKQYQMQKDPWALVNASSHYRKCDRAREADALLKPVQVEQIKNKKLKSALWTTHGGVKRDMGQHENAIALGLKAHQATLDNFRPCTLLGAVNMELGNFGEGNDWYEKAMKRGFTERDMDEDLKKIFRKADKEHKKSMRAFLLGLDPLRFSWLRVKS